MNAPEFSRSLKHELRTPINHIVGYSCLLLETTQEAAQPALILQATRLRSCGEELSRAVERALAKVDAGSLSKVDPEIVQALTHLGSLAAELNAVAREANESDMVSGDLLRIESAARRLMEVLAAVAVSQDSSRA